MLAKKHLPGNKNNSKNTLLKMLTFLTVDTVKHNTVRK